MALTKIESGEKSSWNIRGSKDIRNKLPKITRSYKIDYDCLQRLCETTNLRSRQSSRTDKEAHDIFMQNYKKMFVSKTEKLGVSFNRANLCLSGSKSNQVTNTSEVDHKPANKDEYTHNIKDYLRLLHKERKNEDLESRRIENMQILRHLLKKHPIERTPGENDKIFSILQTFDFFHENLDPAILKELCTVVYMEAWKDVNFYVYGKTGIHMILKGSVVPLSEPYLVMDDYPQAFVSLSDTDLRDSSRRTLYPGDCFGTWLQYEEPFTKEYSVLTLEPNCEFMKISCNDYKRVIARIQQREHTEKLSLLMSCDQYKLWPRQPLTAFADLIEWVSYPPNTVLMSEGSRSPFIGFIRSGECNVLRKVDVLHENKNGKKEQTTKQVVVGRLGRFNSFAEISLIFDEPVMCSIVTVTCVELGIIKSEKMRSLDEVTRQLIIQSNSRTFGKLTKEEIQNEYLQQELKKRWIEFKHAEVLKVINAYGIRPGYGKWDK